MPERRSLPLMVGSCSSAPDSAEIVLPPYGFFIAKLPAKAENGKFA
jgi:hypothetical protein